MLNFPKYPGFVSFRFDSFWSYFVYIKRDILDEYNEPLAPGSLWLRYFLQCPIQSCSLSILKTDSAKYWGSLIMRHEHLRHLWETPQSNTSIHSIFHCQSIPFPTPNQPTKFTNLQTHASHHHQMTEDKTVLFPQKCLIFMNQMKRRETPHFQHKNRPKNCKELSQKKNPETR